MTSRSSSISSIDRYSHEFTGVRISINDAIEIETLMPSAESERSKWSRTFQDFNPPSQYAEELLPFKPIFGHTDFLEEQRRSSKSSCCSTLPWHGWKLAARLSIVIVAIVLLFNITITAWASMKYGLHSGVGTIHQGTCSSIKKTGLFVHMAINVVSTLLLGASNYCMQCLSSPTRQEVDNAHAEKTWLDIGIQSVRNLRRIARSRTLLWGCLAFSSIPLHLM